MISIILADDHKIFLDGLHAILEKVPDIQVEGYAQNGHQALALIRDRPVDIAVLDIDMPGMDGIQTAKTILEHAPNTQVILLTGFDKPEYLRQMRAVGVKGYILKEHGKEELVTAIREVYRGEEYWSKGITKRVMDSFFQTPSTTEPKVTSREMDVLRKICTCGTTAEIAHLLQLKESTVQTHIKHMLAKLNLRNKQSLLLYAVERGYCERKGEK